MILLLCSIIFVTSGQSDEIKKQLAILKQIGDPTILTKKELEDHQKEITELNALAISGANKMLATQALDSQSTILQTDELKITTIKASLEYLNLLLYQSPETMSGEASSPAVNFSADQQFNIVIQLYSFNLFKVYQQFPYPESKYQTIITDITNILDPQISRPFQYLMDTNLTFTDGDPYSDENQDKLEAFMEQTRYFTCIVGKLDGNDSIWRPDCQQQTLVHPNGKVLVECNCFNLSSPISLVNDTSYLYAKPPKIKKTYVIVYRSAILWIIIFSSIIWLLFSVSGFYKDRVTAKRIGRQPKRRTTTRARLSLTPNMKQSQLKPQQSKPAIMINGGLQEEVVLDTKENMPMEGDVEKMKQDSKNNSLVLKFDDDEEKDTKKKRKKKFKFKTSPLSSKRHVVLDQSQQNDQSNHEPLATQQDTKREILNKGAKSDNFQDIMADQIDENDLQGYDEDDEDDDDDYDDEDEFEDDSKENQSEQKQEIKNEMVVIEIGEKSPMKPEDKSPNKSPMRAKSLSKQVREKSNSKQMQVGDKKEEEKIVDPRPLPPITFAIFLHFFLRNHELFGIFYYYKAKESRLSRFIVNHTKNMFVLALGSFFAAMFPMVYNVIIMFVGLLIANGIEQMATILLKSQKLFLQFMGAIVLMAMIAFSTYLFITGFTNLEPDPHEIWLWTFVIVYLSELILLEIVLIGSKVFIQPWLRRNNEKSSPLYLPLFAIFWDKKVQRNIRSLHRQKQNQLANSLK